MESISLGLKKLIFSKKDAPLYETSRLGRERNRKRQSNGKKEGERDTSPFEEVEARSFEMTDDVTGIVSRNDHKSPDEDGARSCQDKEDFEKQENASGFEEIVWQDGDRATDECKSCAQDQETAIAESSLEDETSSIMHIPSKDSCSEMQTNVIHEEKIFRPQGTGMMSLSDSIQGELDDLEVHRKAERHHPISKEQFWGYFDSDGRIVDETQLRRTIFKGGVEKDIRKNVWEFLFELYPCNSTTREREAMKIEHSIRYDALKARWRPLLKQIEQDPTSGVRFCPEWLRRRKNSSLTRNHEAKMQHEKECGGEVRDNKSTEGVITPEESIKYDQCVVKGGSEVIEGIEVHDIRADVTSIGDSSYTDIEEIGIPCKKHTENYDIATCTAELEAKKADIEAYCSVNSQELCFSPVGDSGESINDGSLQTPPGFVVNVQGSAVDNIQDAILEAMMEEPRPDIEKEKEREAAMDPCSGEESQDCSKGQYLNSYIYDGRVFKVCSPPKHTAIGRTEDWEFDRESLNKFCYVDGDETDVLFSRETNREQNSDEISFDCVEKESLGDPALTNVDTQEIDDQSSNVVCLSVVDVDSALMGSEMDLDFDARDVELKEHVPRGDEYTEESQRESCGLKCNDEGMGDKEATTKCARVGEKDIMEAAMIRSINGDVLECPGRVSTGYDKKIEGGEGKGVELSSKLVNGKLEASFSIEKVSLGRESRINLSAAGESKISCEDPDLEAQNVSNYANMTSAGCEQWDGSDASSMGRFEKSHKLHDCKRETELLPVNPKISGFGEKLLDLDEEPGSSMHANVGSDLSCSEELPCRTSWNLEQSHSRVLGNLECREDDAPLVGLCKTNGEVFEAENKHLVTKTEGSASPKSQPPSSLSLRASQISPIGSPRPSSGVKGQTDESEAQNSTSVPPWLQQQLKASSPAGTKTKRTIRIHEEGLSSIENIDAVMPLKEITEKATLAVQKQLIEQERMLPRSSTPVEERNSRQLNMSESSTKMNRKFVLGRIRASGRESRDIETFSSSLLYSDNGFDGEATKLNFNSSSKGQTDGEISSLESHSPFQGRSIEPKVVVGSVSLAEKGSFVDPETGEDGKPSLRRAKDRHRTSLSTNFDAIETPTQRPLDRSRKALSVANLNDSMMSGYANQGGFNLIKNLDESISKSDTNVYKVGLGSPQSSQLSCFELHDDETCAYCATRRDSHGAAQGTVGGDLKQYIEIQAKLHAARQDYDIAVVCKALRIIDKDVPRTDRELEHFKGVENQNLLMLRDALITYAVFHPDVGYAQGMNDIMSRFFVVMESEADAYWMFCNYMNHFKGDFLEGDMLHKISLVEQLLMKMDRELYDFFQNLQLELIFCHRWLLLSFKREFAHEDALRIFEIVSSRHLEVSSVEAEMERSRERARELEKEEGSRTEEIYISPDYSFDVFICVAMLQECRDQLMSTHDIASIYQILSSLPNVNDVDVILSKAEDLFFNYCRKSTVDCFQLIDEPVEKKANRKQRFPFDF